MRIGLFLGATRAVGSGLDDIVNAIQMAEKRGFASVWMANIFGLDAVSTLTIAGRETSSIELGTAVTPTYPRHPSALAQQALTASAASHGRFTLGIGLSHKVMIEDMLGMSYSKPAAHMEEYLQVIGPLLRGEPSTFQGEQYRTNLALDVPGADTVGLIVAALGPKMLRLTGALADGTSTWVTGMKTLEEYIVPTIKDAAAEAGRDAPRIIAGLPVVVTDDVPAAKARIAEDLKMYASLPSYRAMLDREGVAGPEDVALIGNADTVRKALERLRQTGATDFNAAITPIHDGDYERTLEVLQAET